MVRLLGTWRIAADRDPAEVDHEYFLGHVPLVRRLPRLRRYVITRSLSAATGELPAWDRCAELWFDSVEDLRAAMATAEFQAGASDSFAAMITDLRMVISEVVEDWSPVRPVPAP